MRFSSMSQMGYLVDLNECAVAFHPTPHGSGNLGANKPNILEFPVAHGAKLSTRRLLDTPNRLPATASK